MTLQLLAPPSGEGEGCPFSQFCPARTFPWPNSFWSLSGDGEQARLINPNKDRTCEYTESSCAWRCRLPAASPPKLLLFPRNIAEPLNSSLPARPTCSGFAASTYRTAIGSWRACGKIRRSSLELAVRCLNQMPACPSKRRDSVTIGRDPIATSRPVPALGPQDRDDRCHGGDKSKDRDRGQPHGLPAIIMPVMKAQPVPHKPGRNV
jgi:hypothetical protein